MRHVMDSISWHQIFPGAFLDQVTSSEPLSPKFFSPNISDKKISSEYVIALIWPCLID